MIGSDPVTSNLPQSQDSVKLENIHPNSNETSVLSDVPLSSPAPAADDGASLSSAAFTLALSPDPIKRAQGIHLLSNGTVNVDMYPDDAKDKVLVAILKVMRVFITVAFVDGVLTVCNC